MTIETILSQPAVERIGWALLHFVWQGTAIAILLAVALMLLRNRSANSRYIASCAAMVLMAMVFASTIRTVHVPAPVTAAHESSIEPLAPGEDVQRKPLQAPAPEQIRPLPELGPVPGAVMSVAAPPFHLWQQRLSNLVKPVLPWVVCGWLIGVIILSLRLLGGWARVQYLKRRFVEPVADRWERALAELVERLKVGQKVRLVQSALAQVPTVIGWLRPVILLPASALTGLKPQEIEALIAHELAHIRRYDYLVNLFQTVIETVLFYHPAVWWVSHRIRVERENCCDDLAVAACGDVFTYARALTDMEEIRSAPLPRLAMAWKGGSLMNRIRRLLGLSVPECNPSAVWLAGLCSVLAAIGLVVSLQISAAQPSSAASDDRLGLSFDGVYDFVEVPDSKLLDIGDEFTLEAWIKVRNAPGERAVVSKEVPWKSGYTLIVREVNDRSCAVTFAIGSGNRFTNLTVPSDNVRGTPPASDSMPGVIEKGKRHHVAATWQRGKVSLFVDGQCVGMNLFPRAVPARAPLMIGQASGGLGRQFDGEIAEVRIWNVARSQKDILNNMHRKLAEKESGLVARWILQKGSGRAVHDMSPNHLDGVVHGSEQVDANPEPTVQRLIAQLKDPDPGARKNAVMQLGELYDLRAVGPLVGAVVKAFLTAIRDGDMETMLPLVVEYPPDWTVARRRKGEST